MPTSHDMGCSSSLESLVLNSSQKHTQLSSWPHGGGISGLCLLERKDYSRSTHIHLTFPSLKGPVPENGSIFSKLQHREDKNSRTERV
ncbi:hypothetical protein I7I50_06064 [Histoplasma capsulatum G186AR]|uniref:Uncharacterized protein n=1 Tax=Ajellomyces capsulatus TaxID=5037 RepID=A0A8H7Z011_AJECA|nr:hypothetical protein I7I52_08802 [Histoplasma capsulatum]QSS67083.1 hypothetical protein I7I50_06064 [Histoplasma capsulatum G186AR]